MKFNSTLTEVVTIGLAVDNVVALIGDAGIGKSTWVRELAASMSTKAFVLGVNGLADKADLTGGRLVPTPDGSSYMQVFYPHQVIQEAIAYAEANPRENPILFLDEINRASSDVTSAALSLPTDRKIGSMHLPKNLRIMVAANDKGNIVSLDDASLSRFTLINVEPEAQTLIVKLGASLNPYVKKVLNKHPELVVCRTVQAGAVADGSDPDDDGTVSILALADSGDEMLQFTTPRTIEAISKWLNAVDDAKLLEYFQTQVTNSDGSTSTMLGEIIEAHIGATLFATHLLSEIADGLSSGQNTPAVSSLSAPKPNCFAELQAATTISDLETVIGTLTDREKSGSLVYALFERRDNRSIIQQLAEQTDALEQTDTALLLQLAAGGALDDGNVDALRSCATPVATTTSTLLGHILVS